MISHYYKIYKDHYEPISISDNKKKLAIAAAGAYIDRKVAEIYPQHGATVNPEKQTAAALKMLYLNDLVENGVLVKKSGATAIAATGKTAGFAYGLVSFSL